MTPKVSIVILNYQTSDLVVDLLRSINKYTKNLKYEVIIVDNNSSDDSFGALQQFAKSSRYKLVKNKKNLGFAKGNNVGAKHAKGEYLLIINSDTLFTEDAIHPLVKMMDTNKSVGIVTCGLLNSDKSIQASGGFFPNNFNVFAWMSFIDDLPFVENFIKPFHPSPGGKYYKAEGELDWVTGAFILIRTKVFKDLDGFDEDFFMYTEDVDLCFRVKDKGYNVRINPKVSIVHFGQASGSLGYSLVSEFQGLKLYYKKYKSKLSLYYLRLVLKLGAALRIIVLGIIKGPKAIRIYAKAFITA